METFLKARFLECTWHLRITPKMTRSESHSIPTEVTTSLVLALFGLVGKKSENILGVSQNPLIYHHLPIAIPGQSSTPQKNVKKYCWLTILLVKQLIFLTFEYLQLQKNDGNFHQFFNLTSPEPSQSRTLKMVCMSSLSMSIKAMRDLKFMSVSKPSWIRQRPNSTEIHGC